MTVVVGSVRKNGMRYEMKQKVFSLGHDFTVKDGGEADRFYVRGRSFSVQAQFSFEDMHGQELARIQQKLLSWRPAYEIYRKGALAAVVRKELVTLLRCRFMLEVPGLDGLEARGSLDDHEYEFWRHYRLRRHDLETVVHLQ